MVSRGSARTAALGAWKATAAYGGSSVGRYEPVVAVLLGEPIAPPKDVAGKATGLAIVGMQVCFLCTHWTGAIAE